MRFEKKKIQFVYIDLDYLKYLHRLDSEIYFEDSSNYKKKPHIGILINQSGYQYVIPLTSAKEKHKKWDNVASSWFRIYEIIDTRKDKIGNKDIVVDIKNFEILKSISKEERPFFKQKILSILDLRKMFPVIEEAYTPVPMEYNSSMDKSEKNRYNLLLKEYLFLVNIREEIESKSSKIYEKQISKGRVLKYHCDFQKLEKGCNEYLKYKKEQKRHPSNPSDDILLGNPRKPEGEAGAAMLARMNKSHGPVTEWALEFMDPRGADQLLDIGCGGGATIGRLAAMVPGGKVTGVDYSPVSVQESIEYNKDLIGEGRVEVIEASVEKLPFEDCTFDRITTVESFYFWPAPDENLKEVLRVLKPGGHFFLIADIYGKAGLDQAVRDNILLFDLFNPSKEEFLIMFRDAGFTAVKIHVKDGTDWICVEGIR